ncbi:FMN-binding protein [Natranaerobius thermophilus]|uniref:FMN-binding domain-containing protein n=1 Tax=Natranaerobius thermophilus (strain ATCC BAA-1301 / DSM 18059 / JW/NM-WN-LF) TaxID=457570 RepID=B2A141_NATTJ|nr:FMN-binding protein [Natranaerobius thermophilus]ACB84664.1 hypothetical protein Nther_1080 [Natranaerobius thermophilus JW/NM-WN-LF]
MRKIYSRKNKYLLLLITLALLATFTLTACNDGDQDEPKNGTPGDGEDEGEPTNGEDGMFSAASEADDRGYVYAEVTLENDQITDVELTEFNDKGLAKGEDYGWEPWHEAMDELPDRFVEANSSEIEAYSEATTTSNKAMGAVDKAIQKSEGQETFDGTFMGTSEIDKDLGWGVAWVVVEDEEITEVQLEEVTVADEEEDEEDKYEFKDDDYDWEDWQEARETMPDWFEDENTWDVDIYTGATQSSEMWREAVKDALEKAGIAEDVEDDADEDNDQEDDEEQQEEEGNNDEQDENDDEEE